MKKTSLFNSGKTMFTPEEWEKKRKEIEAKALKYDKEHDVSIEDEQLINELQEKESNDKTHPSRLRR